MKIQGKKKGAKELMEKFTLNSEAQTCEEAHPCLSFSSLSLIMSISLSLASRAVEKPDDHSGILTFIGAEIRPAGEEERRVHPMAREAEKKKTPQRNEQQTDMKEEVEDSPMLYCT